MAANKILVSVIIPTHNRRDLLLRLLQALTRQTFPSDRFEVLVVNNYTDDGTREAVLCSIEAGSGNIAYFKKNYNGPAASRQFGAENARGRYLAFIDDDCVPRDDWLERGVARLAQGSEENAAAIGLVQGKTLPHPQQPRRFIEKTVLIDKPSIYFETCNIFYSREAFLDVGGFSAEFMDKFYGEDTDLGWKIKTKGYRTEYCASAVVYHEVFHVNLWVWFKEPLYFKNIPYLAKKFPDFRQHMFARYFLSRESAAFNLLVIGMVLTPLLSVHCLLLGLPYLLLRYRSGSHLSNPLLRVVRIVAGIPRSLFTWVALTAGSLRYQSVLI